MTLKEEMIEFLYKAQLPLYFEEKQLIKEFIETFFAFREKEPPK
jgi:hypothetical protein